MNKFAVIVVGYNRIESMLRTIDSVCNAYYGNDNVDLIISIDHSGNDDIVAAANNVSWDYGKKIVRYLPTRLGLRKHILSCGDYLDDYDAVAVLEDDIYVSPSFFSYMKAAVSQYQDDNNIAGISLYSFGWNPIYNAPFYPQETCYDTFFIQYAQSWGQIWMKKQWKEFIEWYEDNEDIFDKEYDGIVPLAVHQWANNSWLKYHIRYCADKNKYFVFPYTSLSTNMGESGEHYNSDFTRHQVPIQKDNKESFNFASLSEGVKYDVFFENQSIGEYLNIDKDKIIVDIYGNKSIELLKDKQYDYLLSTELYDYEVVDSFALSMRPQEDNVAYRIKGNSIYLYKINSYQKNRNSRRKNILNKWNYYTKERFVMFNEIVPVFTAKFISMIKGIFNG